MCGTIEEDRSQFCTWKDKPRVLKFIKLHHNVSSRSECCISVQTKRCHAKKPSRVQLIAATTSKHSHTHTHTHTHTSLLQSLLCSKTSFHGPNMKPSLQLRFTLNPITPRITVSTPLCQSVSGILWTVVRLVSHCSRQNGREIFITSRKDRLMFNSSV